MTRIRVEILNLKFTQNVESGCIDLYYNSNALNSYKQYTPTLISIGIQQEREKLIFV